MKLNNKQFEYFKKRCEYWLEYWGLKNWDVRYKFEKTANEEAAVTSSSLVDHMAVITLDNVSEWDDVSNDYLDKVAFHEVDEVRYARIESLAGARFLDPAHFREAVHELIVQEENVVFKKLIKPKKEDL